MLRRQIWGYLDCLYVSIHPFLRHFRACTGYCYKLGKCCKYNCNKAKKERFIRWEEVLHWSTACVCYHGITSGKEPNVWTTASSPTLRSSNVENCLENKGFISINTSLCLPTGAELYVMCVLWGYNIQQLVVSGWTDLWEVAGQGATSRGWGYCHLKLQNWRYYC